MHGTQFVQFSTEVLRQGATAVLPQNLSDRWAVLPQNLSDRWLDALMQEADRLKAEEEVSESEDAEVNSCAGILGAVLVLAFEQRGHPFEMEIATADVMDYFDCYIIALAAETVSRYSDIWIEPPTVENIFDAEREVRATRRVTEGS